jgi:hypothetical protein
MRYLTYYIDKNKIDINNSIFTGTEEIFYNNESVSRKWSFWGTKHSFEVVENSKRVRYEITTSIKCPMRIGFDITRDNEKLLEM